MSASKLDELKENFELFDNWEDRYRYLIDLGRKLPKLDDALKTEEFIVKGCTSQVWMVPEIRGGHFYFKADSDAHIVRGLIGVLDFVYQGIAVDEIAKIDIRAAFDEIGLSQHLSPNRRNGFFAMVERIRAGA